MIKDVISEQKVGLCLEKAAHSLLKTKAMITCAEEGGEAIQGEVLHPLEALCANRIELQFLGWRERGVVPDGVEDDVGERIQRAVAVADYDLTWSFDQTLNIPLT